MGALFDTMSEELFQILKGSGKTLTLYDVQGNRVYDPAKARTVFAEPDKMVLSVKEDGNDSEIKLYLSSSADVEKLVKLINTLRHISTRYNVLLNVRKYGRELSPKDFAFQAEPVSEAINEAMWGSTKTSYQKIGGAKLIIRHSNPVREDIMGGRTRNILSMFVETPRGERLNFPVIHLSGARAWARHLAEGGQAHDELSTYIIELARESHKLAQVNRFLTYNRNNLDETAMSVRYPVRSRLQEIRKALIRLHGSRGYSKNTQDWTPAKYSAPLNLEQESLRLGNLLGIDSTHALAENLVPVALLTIGENKMFNSNETFRRILTVEHDQDMTDLVEALVNEYGHEEHIGWSLDEGLLSLSDDVFEDAINYLNDLNEVAYHVFEEDEDKFLAYAKKWVATRLARAGEGGAMLSKEQEETAQNLAVGLKSIIAGKAPGKAILDGNPRFTNPQAEMAYKIAAFLQAGSGLKNDALWTYMSHLVGELQHGEKLTSTEQMFATKIAQMATATQESVDEDIFQEANREDPDSHAYDPGDSELEGAENEIHHDFMNYHLKPFLAKYYPFLTQDGSSEDPLSSQDMVGELTGYLDGVLRSEYGIEHVDARPLAKEIFPELKAYAEKNGWSIEDDVQESFDRRKNRGTFDSVVVYGDDGENTPVTVEYETEMHGIEILGVYLKDHTGLNVIAEIHPDDLLELRQQAEEDLNESAVTEDALPLAMGDYVSTPMGPGQVDEVNGEAVSVQLQNGKVLPFHIEDLEKVDVDAEMNEAWGKNPSFKAYIELNGQEDVEVTVEYAPNDEGVDIEGVYDGSGHDIMDQMSRDQLIDFTEKAMEDAAEQHAADQDARRERDHERRQEYKESAELDEWFAQFTPESILAPSKPLNITLEDVHSGLAKIFSPEKLDAVWKDGQHVAQQMINNPARFGIMDVHPGMDDFYEELDDATSKIATVVAHSIKEKFHDVISDVANESLEEQDLVEYGANDFVATNGVIQTLVDKYLIKNWELTVASPDKLIFRRPAGKYTLKLTVLPGSVIVDVLGQDKIVGHRRFGEGGEPLMNMTAWLSKIMGVKESAGLNEVFAEDEDNSELGGDKSDMLIKDITNKNDQEAMDGHHNEDLDRLRKLAGL